MLPRASADAHIINCIGCIKGKIAMVTDECVPIIAMQEDYNFEVISTEDLNK